LTVRLVAPAPKGSFDEALEGLLQGMSDPVESLLLDKGGQLRADDFPAARCFGARLGEMLRMRQIRTAMLIDPKDYFETAVCVFAMERGARIIAAHSLDEAQQWLDGHLK
jgi:hypothetical protein